MINEYDVLLRCRDLKRKESVRVRQQKIITSVAFLVISSSCVVAAKLQKPEVIIPEPCNMSEYYLAELEDKDEQRILAIKKLKEATAEIRRLKTEKVINIPAPSQKPQILDSSRFSMPNFKKVSLMNKIKLKTRWAKYIQAAAKETGLEAHFIEAVIIHESGANPKARSHCGALGLMQLMPETAQAWGCTNRLNPEQNIKAGSRYLAWLLKRYNGNKKFALAAYNAGQGAVDKYKGIPPYKETINYVPSVLAHYDSYKKETV